MKLYLIHIYLHDLKDSDGSMRMLKVLKVWADVKYWKSGKRY
jgi:hypothetical protein